MTPPNVDRLHDLDWGSAAVENTTRTQYSFTASCARDELSARARFGSRGPLSGNIKHISRNASRSDGCSKQGPKEPGLPTKQRGGGDAGEALPSQLFHAWEEWRKWVVCGVEAQDSQEYRKSATKDGRKCHLGLDKGAEGPEEKWRP